MLFDILHYVICNLEKAMADFIFVATLPFLFGSLNIYDVTNLLCWYKLFTWNHAQATSMFFRDFIYGKLGCKILTGLLYMSMYNSAYTVWQGLINLAILLRVTKLVIRIILRISLLLQCICTLILFDEGKTLIYANNFETSVIFALLRPIYSALSIDRFLAVTYPIR